MQNAILSCVVAVFCLGEAPAQDFVGALAAAQAKIDSEKWEEALAILFPLQDKAEREEDVSLLAAKLREVGVAVRATDLAVAHRAFAAELAMRKRAYGDRDHLDVAKSLNNVAHCLWVLGRAGEALPQFDSTLAMRKRLYGDRDHPDVVTGLNNVAACLESLGRAGEAVRLRLAAGQRAAALTRLLRALAIARRHPRARMQREPVHRRTQPTR